MDLGKTARRGLEEGTERRQLAAESAWTVTNAIACPIEPLGRGGGVHRLFGGCHVLLGLDHRVNRP